MRYVYPEERYCKIAPNGGSRDLSGVHIFVGGFARVSRRVARSGAVLYRADFQFSDEGGNLTLQMLPPGILLPLLYKLRRGEHIEAAKAEQISQSEAVLQIAASLFRPRRKDADELISESHEKGSPIQ